MLQYLLLLATLCCGTLAALPVVLVHGIDARNDTMFHARDLIQQALPGTFVVAPNIGDGQHDSVFMNMNQQVALLCEQLGNTPELQGGSKDKIIHLKSLIQDFSIHAVCTKFPEVWE